MKQQLNPSIVAFAVTIVDQMLQPGLQLSRTDYAIAEACIRTIRQATTPADPPKETQ